uniref:Cor47 n=1 Tax=Betula platyphylla TaxID=78630 RepID=A0A7D7KH34_BETPL|nr:Cor47 [Betula platyphylla]
MAEEHQNKPSYEYETAVRDDQQGGVETKDRGLFDFLGKKQEEKPQEEVLVNEFEKVKVSDQSHPKVDEYYEENYNEEEEQKKKDKHGLLEKLRRSGSSSSSSSDEEEGEGEEKKKKRKEKKGTLKEKFAVEKEEEKYEKQHEEKYEEKPYEEKYEKHEDTTVPVHVEKYEEAETAQLPAEPLHVEKYEEAEVVAPIPEKPAGVPVHEAKYEEEVAHIPAEPAHPEEKKGFLEKIKEKLPGQHKKGEEVPLSPPSAADYAAAPHEGEAKEKKGILEKIKEKIPGYHPKTEEEKEKEKDSAAC